MKQSSGRRLWLARWMTSPSNPLVARVMVNRVWQWHFGEGLVASENDFGVVGQRPSHPELLDYLATEFVQSGWSLKQLHRLIVSSRTYQVFVRMERSSRQGGPGEHASMALETAASRSRGHSRHVHWL